jgi:hypothetical protein
MNSTNEPEILPFTGPPPAYFDPLPNARNNWHTYRCVARNCGSVSDSFFRRQKWTWGRWERIAACENKAIYVTSTPPSGNLAQGHWGQPPLTLFDYQQLLLGIELVPYVPHHGAIHTFDGSPFELSRLTHNQVREG